MKPHYYGTDEETILELGGRYYLIQSPDLGDREYEQLRDLPEGFEPIDPRLCSDLEIPNDLQAEETMAPVRYAIEHHDSEAINAIAHSVESARLISDVPDAISCGHGIAIIEIDDDEDADYLEELLEDEDSVIVYR